ncbi:MAG: glycoside hydrolase family 127 protein [Armatimonadetes bacterium]|nr:glycoside hydrolase family 127 protein [Armatimonadota bacterium]
MSISSPSDASVDQAHDAKDSSVLSTRKSPHARIHPVPISSVRMMAGFWKPWMEANRTKGLPALLEQLEQHGVVDNFRRMSGRKAVERKGPYFSDSDLYKWMEGAAWAVASDEDAALESKLDAVIDDVAAAQRPDGYLNTFFVDDIEGQRFRNLSTEHELYCAGHLFQAAIAHYRATGKAALLKVAERFADYLVDHFGPGKIEQVDGHPEVEMALIELYRTTGRRSYLELAGFMISAQHFALRQQIGGHAVREGYIAAGAADYFAETGDEALHRALDVVWHDMSSGKVYITGGLGSRHGGEAVGNAYELPNERAYAETCAAISNAMWNFRMLGITGDGRYADMMERALYNGFLSGVSLDTAHWFYVNPLACWESYQRSAWFGCTCCPTNAVRMLASIPGYLYGTSDDGIWVHLYEDSQLEWCLSDGVKVLLTQETHYPWEGKVRLTVNPERDTEFSIHLRAPAWCSKLSVAVCGEKLSSEITNGYITISRKWKRGDNVELTMEMPVELMESDRRVAENRASAALQRGPLVYCLESTDNPGLSLRGVQISRTAKFEPRSGPELLGGVTVLAGVGTETPFEEGAPLYRPLGSLKSPEATQAQLTAIPYYAWANRGISQMEVWIPLAD